MKLTVTLDKPDAVFMAGQTVSGVVELHLNKPKKMRRMYLRALGQADVHWSHSETRGSGDNKRTETVHYSASENYFKQDIPLISPETAEDGELVQPAGSYRFPFSIVLPMKLPSTFTGHFGSVKYSLDAIIDIPMRIDDNTRLEFPVIDILDVNDVAYSAYAEPSLIDEDQDVSCCCLRGRVFAQVSLNKRCFVPGETILISAEVQNRSNRKIKKLIAVLEQHVEFSASRSGGGVIMVTRPTIDALQTAKTDESIPPGGTGSWVNVPLIIPTSPAVAQSKLEGCSIIDIKHILKFSTEKKFHLAIDIIIGNAPVHQDSQPEVTFQSIPLADPELAVDDFPAPPPPAYDSLVLADPSHVDNTQIYGHP